MSKFYYSTLMLCLLSYAFAFGQLKRNSLYVEVGGNAGIYSLNYDRLLTLSEKVGLAPRAGLSWLGKNRFLIPIEANLLFGNQKKAKSFGEFGIGVTTVTRKYTETDGFFIVEIWRN